MTPYRTRSEMIEAGLSLDEQADTLTLKIAELKLQIGNAKGRAAAAGDYSDSDWFARANHALRMSQREHQQVQREIGERNRNQRGANAASFERAFISVARRRLEPDTFNSILAEAQEERPNADA